mgnify:FL=1|tara:strand:+ start:1417 stop:1740 length:324 start_codon:yes stop_codon:yes gene_type:complete
MRYRDLKPDEVLRNDDEFWVNEGWAKCCAAGRTPLPAFQYRRLIGQEETDEEWLANTDMHESPITVKTVDCDVRRLRAIVRDLIGRMKSLEEFTCEVWSFIEEENNA